RYTTSGGRPPPKPPPGKPPPGGRPPGGRPPPGRPPPGGPPKRKGFGLVCLSVTAVVTNTLSPQTIGDDRARPGTLPFRAPFLPAPPPSGSCFPADWLLAPGPRNCGQLSARPAGARHASQRHPKVKDLTLMPVSFRATVGEIW